MTKIAYLQCPTGIAGDMCLGALIDAGVPLDYLQSKLKNLGIAEEFSLRSEAVQRCGQRATKVHVDIFTTHTSHVENNTTHEHHHQGRHLPEIEHLIYHAQLPERSQQWSLQVFRQLAQAEGAVHGTSPEQVHFHEVGAVDAIVDIVGTCLGLDWLGIDHLYCSPLPTGGGTVKAAHGILPVPVPAVLQLWQTRQVPVYSNGIDMELVTPTGAALAVTLANNFGNPPTMTIEKIGLGAGSKDLSIPNILRLWIGGNLESNEQRETQQTSSEKGTISTSLETMAVLETQIDDLNPQAIGYIYEILFQAGAVDVFTQAIGMKKSRPGILLTVICPPSQIETCEQVIFQETTTLGIRRQLQQRRILEREIQQIETNYGNVRVKIGRQGDKIINVQPEYEDCARIAKQQGESWLVIQQMALCAWYYHRS